MILTEVLTIIRLSLELALEALKSMPPEERAAFWKQHNEWMAFWSRVLKALDFTNIGATATDGG